MDARAAGRGRRSTGAGVDRRWGRHQTGAVAAEKTFSATPWASW